MKKEDILRIVDNPNFIPGIHNYCDRWCERCAFTARCSVFALEQAEERPEARDIENQAFWDRLHEMFQATLEMVQEMAEEKGIDLRTVDMEEEMAEEQKRTERARNHKLAAAAMKYATLVDEWFEAETGLFAAKERELNAKLEWGVDPAELTPEADTILDASEVIRWYQHQIYVKLLRALGGRDRDEMEELQGFPKDSDGSAKVALIGIDRSLSAWGKLQKCFPEKTDEILSILLHLDRLRRQTESEFPNARNFQRPGFDTLEQ